MNVRFSTLLTRALCAAGLTLAGSAWAQQAPAKQDQVYSTVPGSSAPAGKSYSTEAVSDPAAQAVKERFAQRFTRSEEHTSELQSLMRISYAVFCLKKKKNTLKDS